MRAVRAVRFGGPEVLEVITVDDPVAGPGQVLVEVSVVPVLFIDTQIRAGQGQEWFPTRPPYVPGAGVAGTVCKAGPGVDQSWVGRRVVADTAEGGYLEQAALAAEILVSVPTEVGLDAAAALLHDGRTAMGLVEATCPQPGEWVLVVGAAGGLGALLVQLCRQAGARVVAAARGEHKLTLAKSLGAEVLVDYTGPGWTDQVRAVTAGTGAQVVLDGVGGDIGSAAFAAAADGGRFSAHGAPGGTFAAVDPHQAKDRGITVTGIEQVQFAPGQGRRLITQALAAAAAGTIEPVIGQRFPLQQAAEAHRAIEARQVMGKTLLEVRA